MAIAQHYVETIDLHKRSGLYLTFYSDGDKRERGSALLRLKQLYRAAGLPLEGTELPDYLPVMLEFAAAAPRGPRRAGPARAPCRRWSSSGSACATSKARTRTCWTPSARRSVAAQRPSGPGSACWPPPAHRRSWSASSPSRRQR